MLIPIAHEPDIPVDTTRLPFPTLPLIQDDSGTVGGWSPIIGIVTAIVGNVLISFALNTQRYAHVRLEREQNNVDDESEVKGARRISGDYGAAQNRVAEARARKNKKANSADLGDEDEDVDETDALIPKLGSRQNTSSTTDGAHDDEHHEKQRKSYLRSPLWWIGITLMVTGEAGNFLAYGFAPASIVSPLGVVALISNCLIAPLFLHEKFRKRDFAGVVVAVGGTVTIVLSAQGSNPKLGPDEILGLVKRWEFGVYAGLTVAAIVVLMVLSNKYGHRTILIDLGLVGLFGGYTALSTKGLASLLSYTLWRTLTFPITYALIAVLAGTAIAQIKYVNRALQHFSATVVIPTQFVAFTIFVILGSAVLYRDFESATAQQGGMFVGGIGLTFLGVWLLTSGRKEDDDDATQKGESEYGMQGKDQRRISLVDDESPPRTPKAQITSFVSQPGTTFSTNSFVSALSQPSSSQFSTPTRPCRTGQRASTPAVPTLYQTDQSLHPPHTPQANPGAEELGSSKQALRARPSLSKLFTSSSFSPLTTPLSSGLSVVVADQRGRLARAGSSMRGRTSHRNSLGFGDNGYVDVSGRVDGAQSTSRRGSRADGLSGSRNWGDAGERVGDSSHSRSGRAVEAVIDERPRIGRGATVEVVRHERDEG